MQCQSGYVVDFHAAALRQIQIDFCADGPNLQALRFLQGVHHRFLHSPLLLFKSPIEPSLAGQDHPRHGEAGGRRRAKQRRGRLGRERSGDGEGGEDPPGGLREEPPRAHGPRGRPAGGGERAEPRAGDGVGADRRAGGDPAGAGGAGGGVRAAGGGRCDDPKGVGDGARRLSHGDHCQRREAGS